MFAGATLALVSVPQAVGFSLILGLPPVVVLASMIMGGFIGALFFSSRHHAFGPTGSVSLIVASTLAAEVAGGTAIPPGQLVAFMALIIGLFQFLAGILRFGEVTKFVSRSVVVAYGTAIGLVLVVGQLHHFLGSHGRAGDGFFSSLTGAWQAMTGGGVSWADLVMGVVSFAILVGMQRWAPRWPGALVALVVAGLGAYGYTALDLAGAPPLHLAGGWTEGLPPFAGVGFGGECFSLLPTLLGSAVAVSLIGMLESSAITKTFAGKSGQRIDANQELLGMGVGNVACALIGGAPGASSFTRSAVLFQSGACTQFASMFGSGMALVVLLFAGTLFAYVPLAALAALLARAGLGMISPSQIRVACRSTRSDAVVFGVTIGAALLLGFDIAIYAGVGVSLALFLQKTSSPVLEEYIFDDSGRLAPMQDTRQRANPQIAIIHVEGELYFGAADAFLTQVRRQADDAKIRVFILRLKNARHIDASTVMALVALREYLDKAGRHLLISGCTPDVLQVIRNSGVLRTIGEENVFAGDPINPNVSTRKALIRASRLLDSGEVDIRIFLDKRKTGGRGADGDGDTFLDFQI
ncbi:MAG: SulP family inorganic anion transporter [Puniceicoccales bacterium]|nr:SulP family inorganic anion transporter [Puniceicoccales bacterium]